MHQGLLGLGDATDGWIQSDLGSLEHMKGSSEFPNLPIKSKNSGESHMILEPVVEQLYSRSAHEVKVAGCHRVKVIWPHDG